MDVISSIQRKWSVWVGFIRVSDAKGGMVTEPTRVIPVAAALIFDQGHLLITQRRPGDHLGGLWEFPGGKVECGESFESCLVREIREEVGLHINVASLFDEIIFAYPQKTVRLK